MKNNIRTLVLLKVLLLFGGILFYSNILHYPISCTDNNFILDIKANSSASNVATILEEKFCVNATLFKLVIYTTFNQKNIKPGLYSLKGIRTLQDLVKLITSISKDRRNITIFEGWNIKGSPWMTLIRGQVVLNQGKLEQKPGYGQWIPCESPSMPVGGPIA